MKVLIFAGSLRKESFNKKICGFLKAEIEKNKWAEVEYLQDSFAGFPIFDEDFEKQNGMPTVVESFCQAIERCQAMIVSTPEYNGSIPGGLKNALDWVSRKVPLPLKGKHLLLLGASPGALGGIRALWHTRVPFEALGCHVFPEMVGIPKVHEILGADGGVSNEKMRENISRVTKSYLEFAGK